MGFKNMITVSLATGIIAGTPIALANQTNDDVRQLNLEKIRKQYSKGVFSSLSPEFIADVLLDNPDKLFYHLTNFNALELQEPDSNLLKLLDITLKRIVPYQAFIDSASKNTGIPKNYLIAELAVESAGKKNAKSRVGAKGLGQIMDSKYWTVNRTVMSDLSKLREFIPKGRLEELAKKPFNEQLMLSSDSLNADFTKLAQYLKGYNLTEQEFLNFRLPLALTALKNYGGRLPKKKGSLKKTLFNPELNIHNSALILEHDFLFLYAKNMALQNFIYGTSTIEKSLIPPQAQPVAYNAGCNYASRLINSLIVDAEKNVSDSTSIDALLSPKDIATAFPKLINLHESQNYWKKIITLTQYLNKN